MILTLNTETKEINELFEDYELSYDSADERKLKVDTATVVVMEMVKLAESGYSDKDIQKLYIDILSAYAKRLIDPEGEANNLDLHAKITEIKNSVK